MISRRAVTWVLVAAAFTAAVSGAQAQCAMCETTASAGSDHGAVYNQSTLFMLCTPYILLAAVGGYVAYTFRRSRRPNSEAGTSSAVDEAEPYPGEASAATPGFDRPSEQRSG